MLTYAHVYSYIYNSSSNNKTYMRGMSATLEGRALQARGMLPIALFREECSPRALCGSGGEELWAGEEI